MLYWAEGTKDRNAARFSNSDIAMSALFCRFLRESLQVPTDQIQLRLNVYTNNGSRSRRSSSTGLRRLTCRPRACASTRSTSCRHRAAARRGDAGSTASGRSSSSERGVVQHIYGAIQAYAGIDRPEWLDTRIRTRHAHN
jgi:hypothetical protein